GSSCAKCSALSNTELASALGLSCYERVNPLHRLVLAAHQRFIDIAIKIVGEGPGKTNQSDKRREAYIEPSTPISQGFLPEISKNNPQGPLNFLTRNRG